MLMKNIRLLDLSHTLKNNIPVWPGSFGVILKRKYNSKLHDHCEFSLGCGTHIDAPLHFFDEGKSVPDISLEKFVCDACVIDISHKVNENDDYLLSVEDINDWENQHSMILKNSIVLCCTGWSSRWGTDAYYNFDKSMCMHFPGFSPEAAQLLLDRSVNGIGIDCLSVDAGKSDSFPVHSIMLSNDKFHIENLINLEHLPAKGAKLVAAPIKFDHAAESPSRVFAIIS